MKSIVQEASSIAKAVEQGWIKAQKPVEFSVKILEEPQKNFIGMTVKTAKVVLFFEEKRVVTPPQKTEAPVKVKPPLPERSRPAVHGADRPERAPQQKRPMPSEQPSGFRKQREPLWTDAMIQTTRTWITRIFQDAHIAPVPFTIEAQQFHLRIVFERPVLEEREKEKQLFASFATLILETLKNTYKTGLRGHKIVLTHR